MVLARADLHIHTAEDKIDTFIDYSAKDVIDLAQKKGYSILSVTLHDNFFFDKKITKYARKKGILLIPGIEATIDKKHVLIYNLKNKSDIPKTFKELRTLKNKRKDILVIAPHPFYPNTKICATALQNKYYENRDLFDAIEIQAFYTRIINFNRKAKKVAKNHKKLLIGNSDLHFISQFGRNATLIYVSGTLNIKNVFKAIKRGKTSVETKPMSVFEFTRTILMHVLKREI